MPMNKRRSAVVVVLAVLLVALAELSDAALKATAGLSLAAFFSLIVFRCAITLGLELEGPRIAVSVLALPGALMIIGFFLSVSTIGIRPDSVAPCLGLVTVITEIVTARQPTVMGAWPSLPRSSPGWPRTVVVVGIGILIASTLLSIQNVHSTEAKQHFTSLSGRFLSSQAVSINVFNHSGSASTYRIVAMQGPLRLLDESLSVGDQATKTLQVKPSTQSAVTVTLMGGSGNQQAIRLDPADEVTAR